jgi:hypothetical protein
MVYLLAMPIIYGLVLQSKLKSLLELLHFIKLLMNLLL